jgi:hypothetical protein
VTSGFGFLHDGLGRDSLRLPPRDGLQLRDRPRHEGATLESFTFAFDSGQARPSASSAVTTGEPSTTTASSTGSHPVARDDAGRAAT